MRQLLAPKCTKYIQNTSLNMFSRFYRSFIWWKAFLNVNLVTLRFETLFGTKLHVSYFLYRHFTFIIVPVLELRVHHLHLFSNQTFNFVFESVAFTRIAMCTEQQISFRIIATSSRYLLRKMWIEVLWVLHFVVYFSSEAIL